MTSHQKNIYTIHQNHNFLECLAKGILKKLDNNFLKLREVEIYLPNKRSVLQLKEEFVKLSPNGACIMPQINSIGFEDEEDLALKAYSHNDEFITIPKEISKYDRLFKLAGLIKNFDSIDFSFKDINTNQAILLAYSLVDLLDDCQKYQTNNIEGLNNIFSEELATHKQVSLEFLKYIFSKYPKMISEEGLIEPVAKRNLITETLAKIYSQQNSSNMVVLAGSTGTLPATRKLIKAISQLENGHIILPYIDLTLPDNEWEYIGQNEQDLSHQLAIKNLLSFLEVNRSDVKILADNKNKTYSKISSEVMKPAIFCQNWTNAKLNDKDLNSIQIAEVNNSTIEAQLVAILIKEALHEGKKCALITENKKLISYTKSFLKIFNTNIDDSIGIAYSKTEEGKFLINIAELISSGFKSSILIEILKSPMMELETSKETTKLKNSVNNFEKNLARKYGLKTVDSILNFITKKPEIIKDDTIFYNKYLLSLEPFIKSSKNSNRATDKLISLTKLFLNEDKIKSLNEEAISIIEKIQRQEFLKNTQEADLFDILFGIFSRIVIHPINYTTASVKILAPIEARLLHFDRIIISSVNLGDFPKENFSQWMNKPMKRDFGLPAEELEISLTAHDFSSLLQTDEVFITRSTYDNSEPTSPSPFLTRLEGFMESQGREYKIEQKYLDIISQLENNNISKKVFKRPNPKPPSSARVNKISATGVEKIIKNPYWFYAKEILQVKKLDSLEEPIERRDFGQFVHSSLEEFSNFHQLNHEKIKISELNRIFTKHFNTYLTKGTAEPLWLLETEQISPWFIEKEKERAKNTTISKPEIRGICDFHGLILNGVADRIEIDKHNNLNVIDFKTGRCPTLADIKNLISPQLLLEMVIAQQNGFKENGITSNSFKELGSIIYYSISLSNNGPQITELNVVEKEDLIEAVEDELKNLSDSMLDENTPFLAYPDKNMLPEYDDYYLLARYEY